ncbi:helix-turn-helix domain-containing protein [Georgenia sp. 10Sc9-8]|uniref:Helix-turn-helix domain-containing protein n=1 Tax=Georgenia halotolerans TaxID=3028317 RepID=A0ABT5U154_9MICO|nr:helix-turn-helix domain-containing protein [Georgenia halotolerans]
MSEPSAEDQRELDASALKAYAHPLRVRIMRYLADHGAATATELGRHLDESTGQTSYHLRQLARHGLVEDDPSRGTGRERWWKGTSFRFNASELSKDPALVPAARLVLDAVVQERTEKLSRWMSGRPPEEWSGGSAVHTTLTLQLTPVEAQRLNDEIAAVFDRFKELNAPRDTAAVETPEGAARVRVYYDTFPLLEEGPDPSS